MRGSRLLLLQAARDCVDAIVAALPGAPRPTVPLTWTLPAPLENAWLFDADHTAAREFTVTFATEALPAGLTVHFADDLETAALDGRPLAANPGYDGTLASLPALSAGNHTLRFRTAREISGRPFVWLKGTFTLSSRSAYAPGPNATIRTAGPFVAAATVFETVPYLRTFLCRSSSRWSVSSVSTMSS